ncbi:MAG: endonuclease/exonuclease/phosphatase family protein [Deltaproteobacteria bacterium]
MTGQTEAAYQDKLASLAETISTLAPDILALQELGSAEAFDDLREALGGAYAHGELSKKPDGRKIRVGLLSKHALTDPKDIVDFTPNPLLSIQENDGTPITRMRRGALWVKTVVAGLTINIVTAHLKSKLLTFPGGTFSTKDENLRARVASLALAERTQEAVTLRTAANEIIWKNNNEALIVLGDFNDVPEAASTQILLGPDGSQPDDSESGGVGFNRPDAGDDARLFNLAKRIPAETRYSRVNNGVPELIDQILVSEELVPFTDATKKKRILPIVESHPELQGGIDSVGGNPNARRNKPASDHAPVIATFDF